MRWRVEVTDVSANRRLLREVLGELSIDLLDEGNARFLVSENFEVRDTAGEVHAIASRVHAIVEEVEKNNPQLQLTFKVGDVLEMSKEGSRTKHAFATFCATARATATMDAVVVRREPSVQISENDRKRLEEQQRERDYQQLRRKAISHVVSAFRDNRALQVQRLLQGELTPQTMGHIADLIQEDIGSAIKDLISGHQVTRFYRSINHPDVFGEQARHIVSHVEPPSDSMSLSEARQFIRKLATRWMERKAGLNDDA
jgi:hypothetical protein